MKFILMYFVIPAFILLLVLSPEERVSRLVRYALLAFGLLLLFPSDTCANPQNWWWIRQVGASPLTYAAPVNLYLCLSMRSGDRLLVRIVCVTATAGYYAACVYHRLVEGY